MKRSTITERISLEISLLDYLELAELASHYGLDVPELVCHALMADLMPGSNPDYCMPNDLPEPGAGLRIAFHARDTSLETPQNYEVLLAIL